MEKNLQELIEDEEISRVIAEYVSAIESIFEHSQKSYEQEKNEKE